MNKRKDGQPHYSQTIEAFWAKHKLAYSLKVITWLLVEASLFVLSCYYISFDYLSVCENHKTSEITLKICVFNSCFLHFYNVARQILKVYFIRIKDPRKKSRDIWKCCLIDCYCPVAAFCYLFIQCCYFSLRNDCESDMNSITKWLYIEVLY